MKIRSLGPYTFIEYCGRKGLNAMVEGPLGKRYYVSAANLIPVYTEPGGNRLDRYITSKDPKTP